jgi:hypothetical protein
MDPIIIGSILGGAVGGGVVLLLAKFQPQRYCPQCETPLSNFRKPENFRQAMLGGWTCPNCGLEVDRKGRALKQQE